jgi:hypothetical protein
MVVLVKLDEFKKLPFELVLLELFAQDFLYTTNKIIMKILYIFVFVAYSLKLIYPIFLIFFSCII